MITVVLNAYKRTDFLSHQIEAIKNQTVPPAKIMIWQNKGELVPLEIRNNIIYSECNENLGVWARFAFALNADTEYVCIFDDDTIPGSRWLENCLNTIQIHNGLLGARGLRFMSTERYDPYLSYGWDNPNDVATQVDIVGHSWFFRREWLSTFWRELPPAGHSKVAGEDMHFSYTLQKYLNIPTFVPPHPRGDYELWGSLPNYGKALGTNAAALSGASHGLRRFNEALNYYVAQGFKTIGTSGETKAILIGSGVHSVPLLRKIVAKSPLIKRMAREIVAFLKRLNIHI